jgi:CheY-like chemotaxis protein
VTRKLFLADDSVTIQRVVELTFSGEDIEVVTVSDGEEAIARLSAEAPDIVLADIAMPKKNGYEVAAFMKEHPTLSRVPVLLLAGAFEPVDEERAKRVKCDGVLVKPFETHEVIARVRELIDGARPAEESAPAAPPPRGQVVEMPQAAPTPAPRADQSLDEYFDRLDVAFATRAQNPPRPFPHLSTPGPEPADSPEAFTPPAFPAEPATAATANVIADLFKLFFEVEQGERDVASVRIPDEIERIRRRNTIE